MFGMRNEGADKPYREKLGHHLKLFYGDTFKEGSYWYTHPDENEFFRAVFAKAAGKENADDYTDAAGIESIFFKKDNRQIGIDAKALRRYCTEKQLQALFAACPASSKPGDVCVQVAAPKNATWSSHGATGGGGKTRVEEGAMVLASLGADEPSDDASDDATEAADADVANLDEVSGSGSDDDTDTDDAEPALPAGGDFDDGNFYSDEKKFKGGDDEFNLDGFTASQLNPPEMDEVDFGIFADFAPSQQPTQQPTQPEPTEQQTELMEILRNQDNINSWCVRLSQMRVEMAEGKVIMGWTQAACERRARAMKSIEELEKIMREQDQSVDVDMNVHFPLATMGLQV
jgi:hypothetical protein